MRAEETPYPGAWGELFRVYGGTAARAWGLMRRHLELGEGFAFITVLVPEPYAADLARLDLTAFLGTGGKELLQVELPSPGELAGLSTLLANLKLQPATGAVWAAAVPAGDSPDLQAWKDAWSTAVARVNERRDVFRSQIDVPLLFVGPLWLQEILLQHAPDLWSVRTLVVRLEAEPRPSAGETLVQFAKEQDATSSEQAKVTDPDFALAQAARLRTQPGRELELARLLMEAGVAARNRGRRVEALQAHQEAIDVLRQLNRRLPDRNEADLARGLNNLAVSLSRMGRREEALAPAEESVAIRRRLAERDPNAFEPDLARSLNNLANRLSEVGRHAEALAPAEEAVAIRRRLAERNPDAFVPDLAMSLGMISQVLEGNGRQAEALMRSAEGIALLRRLFEAMPRAFATTMGGLVQEYSRLCQSLGRQPDETLLGPVPMKLAQVKESSTGEDETQA